MNEAINLDEVKRHIQCCIDTEECLFCSFFREGCDKITFAKLMMEAVRQLEAAQPKWISVKERLPEPFVSVLVHIPEEEPLPQAHEGYITPDGTWCSVLYVEAYDRVAHWMPMPEMPEEDE